jgi:hypothetical protein
VNSIILFVFRSYAPNLLSRAFVSHKQILNDLHRFVLMDERKGFTGTVNWKQSCG